MLIKSTAHSDSYQRAEHSQLLGGSHRAQWDGLMVGLHGLSSLFQA